MIQHCPVLIVLLPLTAALLCLLFSKFNKNLGSWLVIGSIAGSLACSLQVLHQTLTSGEAIHYWMGNWEHRVCDRSAERGDGGFDHLHFADGRGVQQAFYA